jgi:hypothetical protein
MHAFDNLFLLSAVALRLPDRSLATLRGRNSHQQNENELLDTRRSCSSNAHSSGVPVALIGQEGIRCAAPFRRQGKSEAAPQLSAASPSLTCHWALPCKAREGGEG